MKRLLDKTLEFLLFLLLLIFPFSYNDMTIRWAILFIFLIPFLIYLFFNIRKNQTAIKTHALLLAVMMVLIFSFAEEVNFIQQFGLSIEISKRIPLSTLILSLSVVVFLIKVLQEETVKIVNHPFLKYFLFTSAFLLILSALFYPFMTFHYQMGFGSNLQLINQMVKYLMLLVVMTSYASGQARLKRLNIGLFISFAIIVILFICL